MKDLTRRRFLTILTGVFFGPFAVSAAGARGKKQGKPKIEQQATESRLDPKKIIELTKKVKDAMCYTAQRHPAGVPYVKQYHLRQIKENHPRYLGVVEKALVGFL